MEFWQFEPGMSSTEANLERRPHFWAVYVYLLNNELKVKHELCEYLLMCGNEISTPVAPMANDFATFLMNRIVGKQLILSNGWKY